jgi:hypothetical protein
MKKNAVIKNVGVAFAILACLTVICVVLSVIGSVVAIRQTEPYATSVELALGSTAVQQALGEPVTVGWFPQGSVNIANGGDAELYIPLRGSRASASIRVNGTNVDGAWKYYAIRVDTSEGEHINLLEQ